MADKYVENVLKKWNLDCLIPKFRDHGIDSVAFKTLDDTAITVLTETKDFNLMFKSKYEQYRFLIKAGVGLDLADVRPTRKKRRNLKSSYEEVDLTIEGDDPQPKSESQPPSFDIEFILQESSAGKQVIDIYHDVGNLDRAASLTLVTILIDFLIMQSDDYTIDNDMLNEIADAIITRFPNEKKEEYYQCVGEHTEGRLVECYYRVRTKLLNEEKLGKKDKCSNDTKGAIDSGQKTRTNPLREASSVNKEGQTPMPEWVEVGSGNNEEMVNLKWESHKDSLLQGLPYLLANEKFVDTTIVCEGQSIKCHKIVLCSYSKYFDVMLASSPCKHPVIFLADLKFWEAQAIIDFMYMGEVNIEEYKLPRLFEVATKLNVEGLSNTDCVNEVGEDVKFVETVSLEGCDNEVQDPLSASPTTSDRKRKKQSLQKTSGLMKSLDLNCSTPSLDGKLPVTKNCSTPSLDGKLPVTKKSKYFQDTSDSEDDAESIGNNSHSRRNLTQKNGKPILEKPATTGGHRSKDPANQRLTTRHFPDIIPPTEKKGRPRRGCYVCRWTRVCKPQRKDTKWMCRDCDVPLCVPDCFRVFHTIKKY